MNHRAACCLAVWTALVASAAAAPGGPPIRFVEVGASRGIGDYRMAEGMGGGAAAADFDGDGDIDLFVPTGSGMPDRLYRNEGKGFFEEIARKAGVDSTFKNRCALWFDYDGDGDLDLIVANDVEQEPSSYVLYRQYAPSRFEDATIEAGLFAPMSDPGRGFMPPHRGGFAAGDLNNDGYLDLFAALWNGRSHLFINNRDGTFADVSDSSGINKITRFSHQPVMMDFDGDGWTDIFVAVDFGPNDLWINRKDGTFENWAELAGVDNAMNDMGVALGDYDNDGDFDLFITNIFDEGFHNVFFRNDSAGGGKPAFTEVSESLGVRDTGWGWGTTFLDADNDGRLDLVATNGWHSDPWRDDPSRCFWNLGGEPVELLDVSDEVGFNDTFFGSALIAFDVDRDGDLDLLQTCMGGPIRLMENRRSDGARAASYIVAQPRMRGPNRFAIGAVVRVRAGGVDQARIVRAGTSYLGQEPAEAVFGLGAADTARITIDWPDGTVTVRERVAANQVITITHGGFGDLDADGDVDLDDWARFSPCLTGPTRGGIIYANGCRAADIDADGDVDLADAVLVSKRFARDGCR
jgi:hypothetical protein